MFYLIPLFKQPTIFLQSHVCTGALWALEHLRVLRFFNEAYCKFDTNIYRLHPRIFPLWKYIYKQKLFVRYFEDFQYFH